MVIYKTTNLINGKIYVGKDSHNNPNYLGSGTLLRGAMKKYGRDNFKKEIIEICSSKEELDTREIYWITQLNARDKTIGYNIADGGSGGNTYTEETRFRISNMFRGRVVSDETRKRMSKSGKGRIVTKETREKISKKHIGKKLSPELVEQIRIRSKNMKKSEEFLANMGNIHTYWVGKKHTEETRKKLSEYRKQNPVKYWQGKKFSEERKHKMSIASTGRRHTEETKNKLRGENNAFFGKNHSPEMKKHLSEIRINRTPQQKLDAYIKFYKTRTGNDATEEQILKKCLEYGVSKNV